VSVMQRTVFSARMWSGLAHLRNGGHAAYVLFSNNANSARCTVL